MCNINMSHVNSAKQLLNDFKSIVKTIQREREKNKPRPTNFMVLDIETTKYRDIIQIAYDIYDKNFNHISNINTLVNEGIGQRDYYERFTIEEIYENGRDPIDVLLELRNHLNLCKYIVCHNVVFDVKNIYRYFERYNIHVPHRPLEICTMLKSRKLCKCLDKNNKIKNPKLSELYFYCFGELPDESQTHTANYDIHITFKCFKYLVDIGHIKLTEK